MRLAHRMLNYGYPQEVTSEVCKILFLTKLHNKDLWRLWQIVAIGEFSWAEMLGDDGNGDDDGSGDQAWHIDGCNGDLRRRGTRFRVDSTSVRAFGDSIGTFFLGAFFSSEPLVASKFGAARRVEAERELRWARCDHARPGPPRREGGLST